MSIARKRVVLLQNLDLRSPDEMVDLQSGQIAKASVTSACMNFELR